MKHVNYEAEATLLGSIIIDGTLFKELEVEEKHFYYDNHQRIFRAMKEADSQRKFIDLVMVTTLLGEDIAEVGGTTYLLEMAESVASTATLKQNEQLILDAYKHRISITAINHYLENQTDEALDVLLKSLESYRDLGTNHIEKNTNDYLVEISEEIAFPSPADVGFKTALPALDKMTGGLQKGDLIIVAARPSVGKTAFALNLAAGHSANDGVTTIFSLEMGTNQLLKRMISREARIDGSKWKAIEKLFSQADYNHAMNAIGVLSTWNMEIYDNKRTLATIRAAIRKRCHDHPDENHLVIIDYLQLMTPSTKKERRDLEIGEMTRELKLLAVELKIPIVVLSQLSRGVEARNDKRPIMSDLRESGNIEQDADLIAFLYRDDYYTRDSEKPNTVEVILSKHRNGPTGTIELQFQKEYGLFY